MKFLIEEFLMLCTILMLDVDECEMSIAQCHPNQDCLNTVGSYRCAVKCRAGFHRAANNLDCEGTSTFSHTLGTM